MQAPLRLAAVLIALLGTGPAAALAHPDTPHTKARKTLQAPWTLTGESPATAHGGALVRGATWLANADVWRAKFSLRPMCGRVGTTSSPGVVLKKTRKKSLFIRYADLSQNYLRAAVTIGSKTEPIGRYQRLGGTFRSYTGRWSNVDQACRARPLRLDLKGAMGLAIGPKSTRGGPGSRTAERGLQAVLADGRLRDAVVSGVVRPVTFAIAPNGTIIVALQDRVDLDDTTNAMGGENRAGLCGVIRIVRATGLPKCIDTTTALVRVANEDTTTKIAPIQFDASGAVYYIGHVCERDWSDCSDRLRRADQSGVTSITDGNVTAVDFAVLTDGSTLVSGYSKATNAPFVRLIARSGTITTLPPPAPLRDPRFRIFGDGNVYMNGEEAGIARFIASSAQMDSRLWVDTSKSSPHLDWTSHCIGQTTGPCSSTVKLGPVGAATSSGRAFTVGANGIVQVFPTLASFGLPLTHITSLTAIGEAVLAAGQTVGRENQLVRVDAETGATSVLSSRTAAAGEIEFYNVVPDEGPYALFDGLRFNDNTYVIGRIDATTGATEILSEISGRLDHFRLF